MIFVCLGNFEKKYNRTRHNVGRSFGKFLLDKFEILNSKSETNPKPKILNSKRNKDGEIWELENGWRVVFLNCFMNESGVFLKKILKRHPELDSGLKKMSKQVRHDDCGNLVIIHDDLDIPFGEFKIQFGRGSAGHKGVESIVDALGTQDFWRVRIGINNPEVEKTVPPENFVLMPFTKNEEERIDNMFESVLEGTRLALLQKF